MGRTRSKMINLIKYYVLTRKSINIFSLCLQKLLRNENKRKKNAISNFTGPPVDQISKHTLFSETQNKTLNFAHIAFFSKCYLVVNKFNFKKLVLFIPLYFFNKPAK